MIKELFTTTGIPLREARFLKPPAGTYGVFMDDTETDGPDGQVRIITHSITLELYESSPDAKAEEAVEEALTVVGLQWRKQARYWLQTEQRYQVIYEFEIIEKRRI